MSSIAAAPPGIPVAYATCDVCGTADVLDLGTCASCTKGSADALVFVDASDRRADREELAAWLSDALNGAINADEARDAATGQRPLLGLPESLGHLDAGLLRPSLEAIDVAAACEPIRERVAKGQRRG